MEDNVSNRRMSLRGILLHRRSRKIVIWLVSIVAAVGILGGLVAPYVLSRVLPGQLGAKLHREVTIEQIRVNPYSMTATIRGFLMKEREGSSPAIAFDELYVNLQIESLLRLGLVLKEIRLIKPYVHLIRNEDNKYNYQDLIDEFTSGPPQSGPPPRFALNNIEIIDGQIDFDDKPEQTKHQVSDIRIGLPFVSSLPSFVDIFVKPELSALVNGAPFRMGGESKPFQESLESGFQLDVKDIKIPQYLAYSPVELNFAVPSGKLSAKLAASFQKQSKDQPALFAISGDVALRDLVMQEIGDKPLISLPSLDITIDPLRVFAKKASIKTIKASGLELYLHRKADGAINLASLIRTPPQPEPDHVTAPATPEAKEAGEPFIYLVEQLLLESGTLHFTDETTKQPYKNRLTNVRILAKGVTNESDKKAIVEIGFETDDKERVTHDGTLQLTPLSLEGKLDIEGLRPRGFKPYYEETLAAEIREGFFDLSTRYAFQLRDTDTELKFSELTATLRNLIVEEAGKRPLWRIPLLKIKDSAVDIGNKSIVIGAIEGRDGIGFIQRNGDGTLNYGRLLKAQPAAEPGNPAPAGVTSKPQSADVPKPRIGEATLKKPPVKSAAQPKPSDGTAKIVPSDPATPSMPAVETAKQQPATVTPKTPIAKGPAKPAEKNNNNEDGWRFEAKEIALGGFKFDFEDTAPKSPVKVTLSELSVRGEALSNAKNQRGKVTIQTKINEGQIRLVGTAGINPVVVNLSVEGRAIDLVSFRPYVEDHINFVLTGGRIGTEGNLTFDAGGQGSAKIAYNGNLNVADFATVEKSAKEDLLKWKLLGLGSIQFALNPLQLKVDEINLAGFYSRLVLRADGKINLQDVLVKDDGKKAPKDEKNAPAGSPRSASPRATNSRPVSIGKINLRDGNINFSDFFVKPNYSANLTGVKGTIAELKPETPADLALEAKLDNAAPVEIRGKINPLADDLFMEIKAKASDIPLSPLSPYSGKYVGYGIEKGSLTFDVEYKLENRELNADTKFVLDQLTFGEKVESPTAMNLPVKLAVALLKDRNGVIDVGLPVSGSLDNPQFSIGGLVWRLLANIITKAVTAPFALLGAAFGGGGGGEDLKFIEFEYGRASLSDASEKKINTLATALTNRPALTLEITGRSDPVNDMEGLKQVSIETKVKAQKLKALARQGTAPKSLDEVQVTKDEYERYLRAAYQEETFPKPRNLIGLAKSLPVPEIENLMLKHAKISDEEVRRLADRRAETVRDRLLAGQIPTDRVFIVAAKPQTKEEQENNKLKSSRVDFSLR